MFVIWARRRNGNFISQTLVRLRVVDGDSGVIGSLALVLIGDPSWSAGGVQRAMVGDHYYPAFLIGLGAVAVAAGHPVLRRSENVERHAP